MRGCTILLPLLLCTYSNILSSRYGLIGLNGAGKSTLLRWIAGYKLEGLSNLKIMLVDQHVEGDEETPMQVM